MTPRKVKNTVLKKNILNPFFSVEKHLKISDLDWGTQMIDCRRWASITSSSTIPIWWMSFWRIWRYNVLQYDVVYRSTVWCRCIFEFCISPIFFAFTKNPSIFSWPKILEKQKNENCIDMVVCGISFRFFGAIERQKRLRCRIGIRRQINFTFLGVFSL